MNQVFNRQEEKFTYLAFFILFSLLLISPLAFGSVPIWAKDLMALHVLGLIFIYFLKNQPILILPPRWLFFPLMLFLGACFFSVFYSSSPLETFRKTLEVFFSILFLICILNLFKNRTIIKLIVYSIIVMGCVVCGIAFARFQMKLWYYERHGLLGPFGNHNHLAGFLEIITPLALFLAIFSFRNIKNKYSCILYCISFFILGVTLFFTLSRAGIASFVSALFLVGMVALSLQKDSRFLLKAFGISGFFLALFAYLNWESIFKMVQSLFTKGTLLRLIVWQTTLQMIADAPVLGHGLGTYPWVSLQYRLVETAHHIHYAHNEYLHMFSEIGLLGFGLTLFFSFFLPWYFIKNSTLERRSFSLALCFALSVAGLSLALHGLYDFNYHIPSNLFYLICIMGLAFLIIEKNLWVVKISSHLWKKGRVAAFLLIGLLFIATLFSGTADAFFWLGKMKYKRKQPSQSMFHWAVRLNPWNSQYRTRLAGFYFDQSQWSKAREHFQKALHLNARLPNNYYHLAQIATREDQLLEAKEFYEKARELDPHEPKKTLAFAEFLVAHDQVGEGLLACREISTKYSDTLKPCLQVLKKHRVPLRLIKAAIPDDPVSHSTFSQYLKEQGEWLELSFWARKLNEEYPPTPQNIYLLAYSAFVQKEDQEALFFVQEGLKRFPAYADLILLHMDLLENQKKFHEISEIFTEQILLESPQTVWLEKYLDFLYAHKRMDEAQNLLSKIHSERPKSISIKELLVQFHQRNEQWAHAIKIYRQMISQGAANHKILEYRKNLAILYFQNGFFSEAIVQWEKIIRNEPRNEGILIALGESYQKKGNSQRALGYYERVLKISPQNENIRNRIEEIKEFRSF